MKVKNRPAQRDDSNRNFGAVTVSVRADTLDPENRTIEAKLSSETPVLMFDYRRGEMVPEVLLASGAEFPSSRQVPLLDSHMRYSSDNQLGSTREIKVDGDGLVGRLNFAKSSESQWEKVRDKHLTDVSVGYEVKSRTFVPKGDTQRIKGREFHGPVNVVTSWRLKEVSITPIGADEMAKIRGQNAHIKEEFVMDVELRALCVKAGMSEDLNDEQAQAWLKANGSRVFATQTPPPPAPQVDIEKTAREAAEKVIAERQAADTAFRKSVDDLVEIAGMESIRSECHLLPNLEKVRERIKEERAKGEFRIPGDHRFTAGPAQRDKHVGAMQAALRSRIAQQSGARAEVLDAVIPASERKADGDSHFRNASLYDFAKSSLEADGVDVRGLTRDQVAMAALGFHRAAGVRSAPAYHVTGSFQNLTLDAVNKSMQIGYTEAPSTWRGPMRQGSSVADFKQIHRMRIGAVGNLPVWPDNQDSFKASMADAKESYAVEAYSVEVDFSWRLIVNEDMDAISRVPQMLGTASGRTVNTVAWSVVTANPTMGDGIALFSGASGVRKRSNLTTGAGAPAVATIQTLTNLMMQMRGENTPEGNESDDILSLMPVYIVGPSALRTTILQIVRSISDPANTNSGVYNPAQGLNVIIEPRLDASSTTAWYLFASPAQIDTIEVTFLQGQETPVVRERMDESKWSQCFKVVQTFAAKAMNHRGIQKHAGA